MKPKFVYGLAVAGIVTVTAIGAGYVTASDHDDGISSVKSQSTNLTDLYVFTEKSQNPSASDENLIFIMNSNPRSLAGQNYQFNTNARYEFHVTRVASNDDTPTGQDDLTLRFEFGGTDAANRQSMNVTAIRDGETIAQSSTTANQPILTTPLKLSPINNTLSLGGQDLTVFAGLREDPFFFDVDQFFKVRTAAAMGQAGSVTFRNPGVDFTAGFNVLSIVARVPRAFLQGGGSATSFDVWQTISVKK